MYMTLNRALLIQRAQLLYYRQRIGRQGVKLIRSRTVLPLDLDPNCPTLVGVINGFVPRGGSIEALCDYDKRIFIDPDTIHWHNALLKGTAYTL